MRCNVAREALGAARDGAGEIDAAAREHVERCDACRAFSAGLGVLDHLLSVDEADQPRPGFDTRFFARLERRKGRGKRWRWVLLAAGAPAVAAATALLLWQQRDGTDATGAAFGGDLELAMSLDMVEDLALLRRLDEVEAFGELLDIDLDEIEAARMEGP